MTTHLVTSGSWTRAKAAEIIGPLEAVFQEFWVNNLTSVARTQLGFAQNCDRIIPEQAAEEAFGR